MTNLQETEGKQKELELSYTYPVEEMGHAMMVQAMPHMVWLSGRFLQEKLGSSSFDPMPGWESKRKNRKSDALSAKKQVGKDSWNWNLLSPHSAAA